MARYADLPRKAPDENIYGFPMEKFFILKNKATSLPNLVTLLLMEFFNVNELIAPNTFRPN